MNQPVIWGGPKVGHVTFGEASKHLLSIRRSLLGHCFGKPRGREKKETKKSNASAHNIHWLVVSTSSI
jgi:hypothetical protein